ncbi:T9SS type A sorting domain-containing protein [Taibaiella soli]|uniref:Secretion system C-terminal sorting domain-containing protein n=1 Tax=Taibaiella soli TaxID=1649169 RepID=A0A2W2BM27_9BACT|nr:T9SS type A sorting domain-containing protein [Taibaiella soli]PZF74496.1 hypothetical protein DN068_02655 [Taibaiella soli]
MKSNLFRSLTIACFLTAVFTSVVNAQITTPFGGNFQTLSGHVFDDGNGLVDSTVNEIGMGGIFVLKLYINVIDPVGDTVITSTAMQASGNWQISNLPSNQTYLLQVSRIQGITGALSQNAKLAATWIFTGEHIGNSPGSDGLVDGAITVAVGNSDITDINFGIEQYPSADYDAYNIPQPLQNSELVLNGVGNLSGSPAALTGTDWEDGDLGETDSLIIVTVPTDGATLYYNGIPVVANQQIYNYDPSLLMVKFTGTGYDQVKFSYKFADAAKLWGFPNTYTINFLIPLDLKLISFTGRAAGDAHVLNWLTMDEVNMDKFEVEYSDDAIAFKTIGSVSAKNMAGANTYQFTTVASNGNRYYRLKMEENDGNTTYSNIVVLKNNDKSNGTDVVLFPNPLGSSTTAHLTVQRETEGKVVINVCDQTGKTIASVETSVFCGSTTIDLNTSDWPAGHYYIALTDEVTNEHKMVKLVK